jgi:hypothetical protein
MSNFTVQSYNAFWTLMQDNWMQNAMQNCLVKSDLWMKLKKQQCLVGKAEILVSMSVSDNHRHLSNIDCLMASTACLVCFISTDSGRSKKTKKRENALEDVALVADTQQNLSNLYSSDIYADNSHLRVIYMYDFTMRFYIAFWYCLWPVL